MTKELFLSVCNKYPPNWWTKFAYKYFSKETKVEDLWLRRIFVGILLGLFGVGFIATVISNGQARKWIALPTIVYAIILAVLVLSLFVAAMMNKWRIKKIIKELGVSVKDYHMFVNMYVD